MPSAPLSYTPPDRTEPPPGAPVRRRHVFFVPGYDPEGSRRYRALFVREFTRYAKRFAIGRKTVSPLVPAPDGLSQTWTVEVETPEWSTTTLYEVLLWDDIVRRDAGRPLLLKMLLITIGILHAVVTLTLFRFYRLSVPYGHVMVYPFAVVVVLVAAACGLGYGAALAAGAATGWPPWASRGIGAIVGLGAFALAVPQLHRFFVWQLLDDWVFNWQHGSGWRRDYGARLDAFAAQVVARAREVGADEVMLVGHSTGALTVVETAARALTLDPSLGTPAAPLAIVTLGSGLPIVAMQPPARGLRAEVARLVESERVVWADYQAPQDWMNFPGFVPTRHLDLPGKRARVLNPFVRSARYRDIMEPDAYRKIQMRPFRLHFQFLMSNDLPGEYDYYALTLGPQRLLERVWRPLIARARAAA